MEYRHARGLSRVLFLAISLGSSLSLSLSRSLSLLRSNGSRILDRFDYAHIYVVVCYRLSTELKGERAREIYATRRNVANGKTCGVLVLAYEDREPTVDKLFHDHAWKISFFLLSSFRDFDIWQSLIYFLSFAGKA